MNISREERNKRSLLNEELSNSVKKISGLKMTKTVIDSRNGKPTTLEYDTGIQIKYDNVGKPIQLIQWHNGLPTGNDYRDLFDHGDEYKETYPIELINGQLHTQITTKNPEPLPIILEKSWFTYYYEPPTEEEIADYLAFTTPEGTQHKGGKTKKRRKHNKKRKTRLRQ